MLSKFHEYMYNRLVFWEAECKAEISMKVFNQEVLLRSTPVESRPEHIGFGWREKLSSDAAPVKFSSDPISSSWILDALWEQRRVELYVN